MKMDKLVGFMLTTNRQGVASGERWSEYDVPVYICATLDRAKQILENSHKKPLEPNTVWTTVYRVVANDIKIDRIENGLFWTHQARKIFADTPVFYKEPRPITEAQLLCNAKRILPQMAIIMNRAFGENKEKQK